MAEGKKTKPATGKNWRETGQFGVRVDDAVKAELIEISEAHGECGPTIILNLLLRAWREKQATV